jgi:transaldolase
MPGPSCAKKGKDMATGYFHRVAQQTSTRFWINLPTGQELADSIAAGAVSCTTNPTYGARLLDAEPDFIEPIIAAVARGSHDPDAAAELVLRHTAGRVVAAFLPTYKASGGTAGFVTLQGDPRRDDDADFIVNEALRYRELGENVMAKIPSHQSGIAAMVELVQRDVPICATEIFALDQAVAVCQAYSSAAAKSGRRPALFVTHITGIFDKYLAEYVQREKVAIAPEVLRQAGWAVAHEQYRLAHERSYPGLQLGGGALAAYHFTEMVGGDTHVTLNWSLIKALLAADQPVVARVFSPATPAVVGELAEKLPAFRQAFFEGQLPLEAFSSYGPLVLFRDMFIAGYQRLVDAIAAAG